MLRLRHEPTGVVVAERLEEADGALGRAVGLLGRDGLEPGSGLWTTPAARSTCSGCALPSMPCSWIGASGRSVWWNAFVPGAWSRRSGERRAWSSCPPGARARSGSAPATSSASRSTTPGKPTPATDREPLPGKRPARRYWRAPLAGKRPHKRRWRNGRDGNEAGGCPGSGLRRGPREAVLRRAGRLHPRPRLHPQRGTPLRTAHPARVGLFHRHRRRAHPERSRLCPGTAPRRRRHRSRARRAGRDGSRSPRSGTNRGVRAMPTFAIPTATPGSSSSRAGREALQAR